MTLHVKFVKIFPMLSRDDIHIILLMHIGMKNIEIAKIIAYFTKIFSYETLSFKKEDGGRL